MQKTKIKVLFLIESMIAGGAERALICLVNAMPYDDFEITLCSMFKKSVYEGYEKKFEDKINDNVKQIYLFDNTKKFKSVFWNFILNRVSNKLIHRLFVGGKYDCEIAFYEGRPTFFLSKSSNKNSKKIAWLHTMVNLSYPNESLHGHIKDMYKEYDEIVAVSQSCRDSFERSFGYKDKLHVIHNILDEQRIDSLSNKPVCDKFLRKGITFVTVGRVCHVKGYDRLLEAVSRLKEEGIEFCVNIVGDGEDLNNLVEYSEKNGLSDIVSFLGHMDNPYPYIKNSDYYLCTSRIEGFPVSLNEAIYLSKPVLSVDFPALHEFPAQDMIIKMENSTEGIYLGLKDLLSNQEVQKHRDQCLKSKDKPKRNKSDLLKFIDILKNEKNNY